MFKTRKLQSRPNATYTNRSHRTGPHQGSKYAIVNQYSLVAKSIIHQLQEEVDLAVRTKSSFQLKATELFGILKKCDYETKSLINAKLLNLYRVQKIKLTEKQYDKAEDLVSFLLSLAEKNQKKLRDLILMEKVDQSLVFIHKCFPSRKNKLAAKIYPLMRTLNEMQNKMSKILPTSQYNSFILSLSYLNLMTLRKQTTEQSCDSKQGPHRPSCISNNSMGSKISEPKEVIGERLKKFDETKENLEFQTKLQSLSQNKKRRNLKRSSSIVSSSTKRISTTWGKQESLNISASNKEPNKKIETGNGASKFVVNEPRKSIFLYEKLSMIQGFIRLSTQVQRALPPVKQFKPFYIYAIIKDNLRVTKVMGAQIMPEIGKLKVSLAGYFNYPVVFHKFPSLFTQTIDSQALKRFMSAHVKLKEKLMWNILYPTLKNTGESEYANKNVVSQLLCENQKFKFFGFVKKFNAFFFTKYESQTEKSTDGSLIIYNANLEEQLETLKVKNWRKHQSFEYSSPELNQVNNDQFENKSITAADCNIRMRVQKTSSKYSNKDRKIKQRLAKIPTQKSKLFHVIRKEHKFVVLTEEESGKSNSYSNLRFETKFRNLFSIENGKANNKYGAEMEKYEKQAIQQFKSRINRKTELQSLSILNRRTNNPACAKIRYEFTFIKKIKQVGYVTCQIFLFKPQQTELILTETYVQQNQKYYTFTLKSSIFHEYLNLDFANCTNEGIHDCLTCLSRLITIKKMEVAKITNGDLNLVLQIGDVLIQGQQLLSRTCLSSNSNPLYIDSFTLQNNPNQNVQNSFEINRESFKISTHLRNQICQTHVISNPNIIKKYGKQNEFLKQIKAELQKLKPPQTIFSKRKGRHFYIPGNGAFSYNNIIKVEVEQKIVKLTKFYKRSDQKQQLSMQLGQDCDCVWELMLNRLSQGNKKGIMKYIGRLMSDPLLARALSQGAPIR